MSGPTSAASPNSYKTVPAYAWAFHEMFRHSDVFQMGAFTFATAMMSSNRTEATLNPTGLLFKMYRDHFGTIPVASVTGDSPQPKPAFPRQAATSRRSIPAALRIRWTSAPP